MKIMKVDQILKLIDAGYTKEEINNFLEGATEVETTVETTEQVAEVTTEETSEENSNDPLEEIKKQYKSLSEEIENVKKVVHKQNLTTKVSDDVVKKDTASDILAKLIDPNYGGK